jgi:L-ascorbate metabolism protein UlaG (beta-lactamase superfamily)
MVSQKISKIFQHARRPANHADMSFGEGWHKRNYLTEIVIPSIFKPRKGKRAAALFPEILPNQVGVTWIGHASFLIQTDRHAILIDPNWSKWLKVVKRLRHPGLNLEELPAIDLVLVTHAHFDHLDKKTLRAVAANQPIVVPEHVGELVKGIGFQKIYELQCWKSFQLDDIKITLTPSFHWGARLLHDQHRGFGGFLIEHGGRTIFHCGDSAYFSGFQEIGKKADITVALLPIGAYDTPTGRDVHMNPEEALQAFQELQAKILIPMHYGTFPLSYEPLEEPPQRLLKEADKRGITDRMRVLNEGETVVF